MFAACERALRPQDRLLVVGNGELEDDVRRWVAERGLQDRVVLLGTRTDIPELMRTADAYVMSSAWEGLPIVLLEASASGLPIVATDVGGNHQLVQHDRTGWLVPAKDPSALAEAMTRMATAPPTTWIRTGPPSTPTATASRTPRRPSWGRTRTFGTRIATASRTASRRAAPAPIPRTPTATATACAMARPQWTGCAPSARTPTPTAGWTRGRATRPTGTPTAAAPRTASRRAC